MSSRQLRKLQQQRELEQQAKLQIQEEEEEEEESDEEPQILQSKPSLFANLAALEDDDDDESKEIDEDEEPEEEELSEPTVAATTKKPKKSKKKKKANNKGKDKDPANAVKGTPKKGLDEIDKALKELNLKQTKVANTTSAMEADEDYERVCLLLGINTQHLKVANEMRSLFGRAATENHEDPGGPTGRGARRQRTQQMDLETVLKGHHKPGKGLSELTIRRNYLIQGKDEWPKASSGGLTMAVLDNQEVVDGTIEYKFVHDETYQVVQQTFQAMVEMGDPQNLIGLIQRNPYNISLLLQVSKIAKDQGDHSLSSDLVERALFTFGRVSLSSFGTKLAKGKARLDFSRPENREFWLAGYHYIKSLMMKGTYRTAFEWAKLLLSLDPEDDPYCMRWMIHHLALRAHEFQWLLDFAASRNVPEWANTIDYAKASFALAAQQLKDGPKCRKLDLDTPKSIWGTEPPTASDILFTELYVLQAKDLWNTPESTSLLMEVAHTIEKPDLSKIPLLSDLREMSLDIVRFVYLDNRRELMSLVPSNILHRSNNSDSDPLPPYRSTISYPLQERHLEIEEEATVDGFNDPLAALARLLPGFPGLEAFRARGAADDFEGEIEVENEDEQFERFRDYVAEAMRIEGIEEEGIEEEDDNVDDGQLREPISPSNTTRILNSLMFWRTQSANADHSESGVSDTETEDDDDSLPGLIEGGEEEHQVENRQAHVEDADDEDFIPSSN
ncbi:hypothetical protein SBOR_8639 [Sclerotinia borealis F-4128]|uniref:Nulp1-pending protein n=1 Tax=Sclerotinia borealis (strain F-4128) TaxID=1432307 RepID=W9C522_SCLBF|nr:hypothetical protein SBOR_8639 [Sclerotinia borealis F-4128]